MIGFKKPQWETVVFFQRLWSVLFVLLDGFLFGWGFDKRTPPLTGWKLKPFPWIYIFLGDSAKISDVTLDLSLFLVDPGWYMEVLVIFV